MDVVLMKDYRSWKKFEIVKVKGGFARNYLIPQGICVGVSKSNIAHFRQLLDDKKKKEQRQRNEILKLANEIQATKWELKVNADGDGKITDKIAIARFVKMIKEQFVDCKINAKAITLKDKIETIGVIKANVKLQMGVIAEISVDLKKNI